MEGGQDGLGGEGVKRGYGVRAGHIEIDFEGIKGLAC